MDDSRFRHHALATRRYFPHSGEDYGSVNKTHEDTNILGGTTYAERQRHRSARNFKKFSHFMMKPREHNHKTGPGQELGTITETALMLGAGRDLFKDFGKKKTYTKSLPCFFMTEGERRKHHCTPHRY